MSKKGPQAPKKGAGERYGPEVQSPVLEPCPQGHGGTVGKRCAYFVDERYLASLGLMALEISYRIPNAAIVPHNHEITDWGLDL